MMIKVLHIVEAFCGGVLGALQTLVNGTSDEFHHYILYAVRPTSPEKPEKLFRNGTVLMISRHLTREIDCKEDIAAFQEARHVFREVEPDIVHLHSSKAGAIGRLAFSGRRVPVFYSPQGYSFLMYQCSAAKRKIYYTLEKICGFRPSITVASCKGEYDSAKKVSRKATYINNGINTEELEKFHLHFEERPDVIKICTLGRIVGQKNPELFNSIAEAFPQISFVWIGGGELQHELTSPNITVTGWVSKEEALNIMMGCSVFLLTSLYEGLAFSIMEAMYFKRLCIVSKIPGNVDAIEDGKTGFLCEKYEDYIRVIQTLLRSGVDEAMLDRARNRILSELNQHVMADRYEQLYKKELSLIDGRAARGGGKQPARKQSG